MSDDFQAVIVRAMRKGTNRPVTYQSEFTILRLYKIAKAHQSPVAMAKIERGVTVLAKVLGQLDRGDSEVEP